MQAWEADAGEIQQDPDDPSGNTYLVPFDDHALDKLFNNMILKDPDSPSGNATKKDEGDELSFSSMSGNHNHTALYERTSKAFERSNRYTKADDSQTFLINEQDSVTQSSSSRSTGSFGRHNREKGSTLPAYAKKISWELDSDDEIIMFMRDQGHSDKEIFDKLIKEGRAKYDPKSINSRIVRIKKAQAQHFDDLLREGKVVWTADDDHNLMVVYDRADIAVRAESERTDAWRFRKVSEHMHMLNKNHKVSADACRDRYCAIMEGVAEIPIGVDDDPKARLTEQEARKAQWSEIREAEQAIKQEEEKEKQRMKEEKDVRIRAKAAVIAARRAAAQAKRDEREAKRFGKTQKKECIEMTRAERQTRLQAAQAKKEHKKRTFKSLKHVTADASDPRAALTLDDLQALCLTRGMKPQGNNHEELVQLLRSNHDAFSAERLRQLCHTKGLVTGTKVQMKYQLALAEYEEFEPDDNNHEEDGMDVDQVDAVRADAQGDTQGDARDACEDLRNLFWTVCGHSQADYEA